MLCYPLALAYSAKYLLEGQHLGRAIGYALLTGVCHPFMPACLAPALALTPWWRNGVALAAVAGAAAVVGLRTLFELASETWGTRAGRKRALHVATVAVALAVFGAVVVGSFARAKKRVRSNHTFNRIQRDELGQVLEYLTTAPPGRIYAGRELGTGSHWAMYLPYIHADKPAVRAYGGAALQSSANYVFLRHIDPIEHRRWLNTRYLLSQRKKFTGEAKVVFTTDTYTLFETDASGYFVPIRITAALPADRLARGRATMKWLKDDASKRGEHYVIGEQLVGAEPEPTGNVVSESIGAGSASAVVDVPGDEPTTILFSCTYHPGWRATIDGDEARIRRVTPDLMAVDVPPGRHTLRFDYSLPWWFWFALLLAPGTPLAATRLSRRFRSR